MRRLRYGIAGLKDPKDLEGSIKLLVDGGYAACEVQFVKEFTLKEPEAVRLGELARDAGIALSVHAPYFASLTAPEPERLKLHVGALHHSCKLAAAMGASVVVAHPGSAEGDEDQVKERIDAALSALAPRVADLGVRLGLETPGRRSQWGALFDLPEMVRRHSFTAPVIDFAHIHAVSNGMLTTPQAFRQLFQFIVDEFAADDLWPLHCHFTDNQFGPQGEIRHVPYGTGSLSVRNLVEGAEGLDLALTVVSEEKDPDSHRLILEDLKAAGAPLSPAAETWPPERKIPLEKEGDAHYYRSGRREVRITNIDKPLFPEGYTKGDLISHYYRMAPRMLRFLRDRPVVMQRVPEGIEKQAFYEKQAPKGRPEWVRTVPVPSDEGRRTIDYVVVDDAATLVWLAQIASVECHAWTSRWPNLSEPDFAVLDLDPHEPITFDSVRVVARHVKVVLDHLKLRAFPKTSGGAGLQVFIPLAPGHTYAEVREFSAAVGRYILSADPDRVTLEPSKARRAGKVFIDANQNSKGKTLVAPYSVRPYPGAPVSTPLEWDELEEEFFPEQFNLSTIEERVSAAGDPFAPANSIRQDLRPALALLTDRR
jgi:bifunctional non-homologous end joining protein LigD